LLANLPFLYILQHLKVYGECYILLTILAVLSASRNVLSKSGMLKL
jgi:hypothetical protein